MLRRHTSHRNSHADARVEVKHFTRRHLRRLPARAAGAAHATPGELLHGHVEEGPHDATAAAAAKAAKATEADGALVDAAAMLPVELADLLLHVVQHVAVPACTEGLVKEIVGNNG